MNPSPRHGVRIRSLGDDVWRLDCQNPKHPAHVEKVTSIGGVKAFAELHRAPDPDALVAQAIAEARR